MTKAANTGPTTFGRVERFNDKHNGTTGGRGYKKATGNDKEGNVSDIGDEDEEEEAARKNRLRLNKRDCYNEDSPRGGDHDIDDNDFENVSISL